MMRISEVLRILQEYQEEYGDIDVVILDEWGPFDLRTVYVENSQYDKVPQLIFS